ncbi:glycosyl hydrolase 115 family protein [Algibacter sp. L3A6]|uniref:glycosyl hydrolase 115 family protein n=1 Tax=Algibacter sp. L3A6 TaxID=2686366 RepID=UPI00131D4303|nr:glycosyl hydrolase 115 family protein [Algibacter sp. L3A6]
MKNNFSRKITFLTLFLCAFVIAMNAQTKVINGIKITGDTPWVITDADYKRMPIQKAIKDAEKDWYRVFGYPPVIFHNNSSSNWDGPVIVFGSSKNIKNLTNVKLPKEKEHFHIFLDNIKSKNKNAAIFAAGADDRGTIYAIYTFTEKVLGIDPMYVFTDHIPKKQSEIVVKGDFEIKSKKPTFEYRGWFINDEELHDGMHRDPLGGNVIASEWMDKILETLLRTKGNMIIPESAQYPDANVYDLCKRRGVAVNHHHVTPVGLNMMNWPKDVPFSFITEKEILLDAWEKAIKVQADKEIVWTIGFRGESDGAFWLSDPAAPKTDEGRAKVIAEAMQAQTDIIRKYQPDATIVAALWNEQGAFYNKGLLKIPEGVTKMFADDGRGFMRDSGGKYLEKGDGLYYHVMMMMLTQNRTTEGVPPARFYKELKRYVEKGATKYAVINVSGIRPAALSVNAMNDFLWDATPALSKSPEASMKDYLMEWYTKEFGEELASKLTDIRLHYYNIPYMREKMPAGDRWVGARGEHLLQYLIQSALQRFGDGIAKGETIDEMIENTKGKKRMNSLAQTKEPLAETADFFPSLWKSTLKIAEEIPEDRKDFYQAHFTYQVAVHMYSAKALQIVVDALEAYKPNLNQQDFANAMELALIEIEKIIEEAHKAEYGKWDTMFMHVRLMDIYKTRLQLKSVIAKIRKQPYTSEYRGYRNGSFWKSAHEYMDHGDGVFPYFHKYSGRGLEVLEEK